MSRRSLRSGEGNDEAAKCIRLLLQRHKVPSRQQSPLVAELLGVTVVHARRKLVGDTPWTLPEVKVVAARFGESLAEVLMPILFEGAERALLLVGDVSIECEVTMGRRLTPPFEQPLVVVGGPGRWLVVPSSDVRLAAYEVCRLTLCDLESPAQQPLNGSASPQS